MHAIAHGGGTDTVRESALKVDSGGKNPLPHRGIEPVLAACRSDALPSELHPRFNASLEPNMIFWLSKQIREHGGINKI